MRIGEREGRETRSKEGRPSDTHRSPGRKGRPNQDTTCAMPNREHKTTQPDRATPNREAQAAKEWERDGKKREPRKRGRKSDHHTGGEQGSAKGHEAKRRQARTIGKNKKGTKYRAE